MALLALSLLVTPMPVPAAGRSANAIPHVNDRARQSYQQYLQAEMHRAYAIAPGGTWSAMPTSIRRPGATASNRRSR